MTPRLVTEGNRRGYKELTEVLMHKGKIWENEEIRMYWALYGFPRSTTMPPQPKNSLSPSSSKRDASPRACLQAQLPTSSPPAITLPPHQNLSYSCHRGWCAQSTPGLPTSLLGHLDSLSYWTFLLLKSQYYHVHLIIRICISDD